MDFDFYMPVQAISGRACIHRRGGAVFSSLGKKCLILTGKSSAKACGALDDCQAVLDSCGIAYEVFDEIGQNPLLSTCEAAGAAARAFGADFLIGIGGGSPLDATKAAAFYACDEQLHGTDIYSVLPPKALPMVLVGTTAGTGSEVTPYAVLTIDETGRKKSFADRRGFSYARYAFCDPRYTESLSYSFTVSTALDALCHVIEGYFSTNATDSTDLFARHALSLLIPAMEALRDHPGVPVSGENRERLLYGSLCAGVTINTAGTGFCHPLGYFLSEDYQVPHGQACAVYLRAFLDEAKEHYPEKFATLWHPAGRSDKFVSELIGNLLDVHLPSLTEEQLAELALRSAPSTNFARSPGVFNEEKALRLLRAIFLKEE